MRRYRLAKIILWGVIILSGTVLVTLFGLVRLLAAEPEVVTPETVASTVPQLIIAQVDNSLQASAATGTMTDWQSVGPNTSSACDATVFSSFDHKVRVGSQVSLQVTDYSQYYCFRAIDADGNYGYQAQLVAYLKPDLEVTQHWHVADRQLTLVAQSAQAISSWQIVGPLTTATCQAEVFNAVANVVNEQQVSLDLANPLFAATNPQPIYYCFRGRNDADRYGYRAHLLRKRTPTFDWSQTGNQLAVEVIDLDLSDRGQYVVTTDNSCAAADFTDASRVFTGRTMTVDNRNATYCFRIQDDVYTYYYSDHQVN